MNRGNPHLVPAGIVAIIGWNVCIFWTSFASSDFVDGVTKQRIFFGGWSQDLSCSEKKLHTL
jgi:hypothetical protein